MTRKLIFFFFNDTATTEIYTLSLHDALPIFQALDGPGRQHMVEAAPGNAELLRSEEHTSELQSQSNLVCRLLLEKKKNQLIWAVASRDQSSMRSSSMRFAPHSPESQSACDEPVTLVTRSAYPEVLTPVITSWPRSARAPGFQKRLAAQSTCQAQKA